MVIVGIDPGKTTGIAVVQYTSNKFTLLDHQQVQGLGPVMKYVLSHCNKDTVVVYEQFIDMTHTFAVDSNHPVQIIGALRWEFLYHTDIRELIGQNPQYRLTVTDDMLKRAGFWVRGEEHTRQALKHIFAHFINYWMNKDAMQLLMSPSS